MLINPNKLPIFDSHAHFDDKAFEGDLSLVVNEMKSNEILKKSGTSPDFFTFL